MKDDKSSNVVAYYPVSRDLVFKRVFNDKILMTNLLKECLEKDIEILEFMPTELMIENKNEKHKRLDLVVKIKDSIVNVEVNTSYGNEKLCKNFTYLCKLHGQNLKKAEANIYQSESIQINLNLKMGKDKPLKAEYIMYDEIHQNILDVKFKYIEINLDKYYEAWYNKNDEKMKESPLLVAISIVEEEELDKYVDYISNKEVRKVRDIVKNLNEDDEFASELSWMERMELETLQLNAYYKEQGLEQGLEQKAIEVAKNLLQLGTISLDDISSSTGLSLETLQKLKEETSI